MLPIYLVPGSAYLESFVCFMFYVYIYVLWDCAFECVHVLLQTWELEGNGSGSAECMNDGGTACFVFDYYLLSMRAFCACLLSLSLSVISHHH